MDDIVTTHPASSDQTERRARLHVACDNAPVSKDTTETPSLRVVRGKPSAVELAALVAVLGVKSAASTNAPKWAPRSMWSHPSGAVRRSLAAGPGGWRASARPS